MAPRPPRARAVTALLAAIGDASGSWSKWTAIAAPARRAKRREKEVAGVARESAILVRLFQGDDRDAIAAEFGIRRARLTAILRDYRSKCCWLPRGGGYQAERTRRTRALVRAVELGAGEPARRFRQQALIEVQMDAGRRTVQEREQRQRREP
jgi:hypothetical protein